MRNIIITGGGLENKGAQAMTFITVNELAKRFPKTSSRRGNTNAKFYIGISLDG